MSQPTSPWLTGLILATFARTDKTSTPPGKCGVPHEVQASISTGPRPSCASCGLRHATQRLLWLWA